MDDWEELKKIAKSLYSNLEYKIITLKLELVSNIL